MSDTVRVALAGHPMSNLPELYRALWMGVPVLSMADRDGGTAKSALSQLGGSEWAAQNTAAYVQAARDLCGRLEALEHLRSKLRQRMKESDLTDIDGFVQRLEAVYRSAWSDWCLKIGN